MQPLPAKDMTVSVLVWLRYWKKYQTDEKEEQIPETMIDIYFDDMGAVLDNTLRIAETLGVSSDKVIYNHELLAMYMIRDPQDTAPRLLFPLFILIAGIASQVVSVCLIFWLASMRKSILSLLSKEVSLLRPMDDNQILLHHLA